MEETLNEHLVRDHLPLNVLQLDNGGAPAQRHYMRPTNVCE